ncbi:MAG TPA: hypothetical protein VH583_18270 [Vicinamibacterales bacterium]|jgi:hypothetical protein
MKGTPCIVSVADHAGWAYVLCVAAPKRVPVVVDRRRITLIDAGLPTLPYHHESLAMSETEANALIACVRGSIAACTARALRGILTDLTPTYNVVGLAIRELRQFTDLPDTIAPVRQSYQLQCAADGMMYQLAVCRAARDLGLDVHLCPRGKESALAAERLDVRAEDVESFVGGAGRPLGPPWTEEHRRAFAAAIAALAASVDSRRNLRIL